MTGDLAMSETGASARCRHYQYLLGFNMLLHLIIGLMCMFLPDVFSKLLGIPHAEPSGWIRGWGATLILVTALYIPGLRDPLDSRYPNICGILGRVWMATTWFVIGGNYFYMGCFDLLFAMLLAWCYWRLLSVEDAA